MLLLPDADDFASSPGFRTVIPKLLLALPADCQLVMLSVDTPDEVMYAAEGYMREPLLLIEDEIEDLLRRMRHFCELEIPIWAEDRADTADIMEAPGSWQLDTLWNLCESRLFDHAIVFCARSSGSTGSSANLKGAALSLSGFTGLRRTLSSRWLWTTSGPERIVS
jgi:hypothetical protein